MKRDSLMWKLLRRHVSVAQLAGFAIANMAGLTIVLLGLQFYEDVKPVFADEDSFIRKDYLVVTKSVGNMSMLTSAVGGASANAFTDEQIADIEAQPWLRKVGKFSTSNYKIYGNISLVGRSVSLRTNIFFESVPDEFIDVKNADWEFDPENPEVPILLAKDYLSLYNFGFAASQGMPQLSESMVGKVPITLALTGSDGRTDYVKGRIVGFSSRLSTIIVPESFMEWSNARYAPGVDTRPSRLILEVGNPGDAAIDNYMKKHGYEIAGDKTNSSKASYMLTVVMGIVIAIGLVISLLSFFILILSVYLLLQKNTQKLRDLLMLGYSPGQVAGTYVKMVVGINAAVYALSVALMAYARTLYLPQLEAMSVGGAPLWVSSLAGLAIIAAITAGNVVAIRRKVAALWYVEK